MRRVRSIGGDRNCDCGPANLRVAGLSICDESSGTESGAVDGLFSRGGSIQPLSWDKLILLTFRELALHRNFTSTSPPLSCSPACARRLSLCQLARPVGGTQMNISYKKLAATFGALLLALVCAPSSWAGCAPSLARPTHSSWLVSFCLPRQACIQPLRRVRRFGVLPSASPNLQPQKG